MAGLFDDIGADASGPVPGAPASGVRLEVRPKSRYAGVPALDDRQRELAVRTILGEAADEPDVGQRAVAAVILNRLLGGQYGNSIGSVVTAKGQFEPWMTAEGRKRMYSYGANEEPYIRAGANLDLLLNGQLDDPTGGADHFYSPTAQAALGRLPPSWAKGTPTVFGRHNFYTLNQAGGDAAPIAFAPTGNGSPAPALQAISNTVAPAARIVAAEPTRVAQAGLFNDVPAAPIPGAPGSGARLEVRPSGTTMDERFGEGDMRPSSTAELQAAGNLKDTGQRWEDLKRVGEDDAFQQALTFIGNAINTAGLNAPRNVAALLESLSTGKPFSETYDKFKGDEEAMSRLNPKSAVAGTVAGAVGGAMALPGVGGAATLVGRAAQAGLTGGGYALVSELLDSKDPGKAAIAGALGAGLGLVAAPVAEKIVNLVSKLVKAGKSSMTFLKPDGTLTDEAAQAAKEAGVDIADMTKVMQKSYATAFEKKGPAASTAREAAADEFGIKLTPGEATNDYGAIAREQAMARDAHGPMAGRKARDFYDAREGQITQAKTGIQSRMADQQPMVDSVNAASNVAGAGARSKASAAKAQYKSAYDEALGKEGEFSDIAFIDIGERIRRDALKGDNPVTIRPKTTPIADDALKHLDEQIGTLRVQDRAQPRSETPIMSGKVDFPGSPKNIGRDTSRDPVTIAGVNMRGVEQMRKELVSFYKAAKASGNAEDTRAVRRIIAGFDDELETAINVGLFKGDDSALPALKKARALFSDYQKTFKSQGAGDSVGRSMEKIVERDATGGDIANLLYGKAAIGEKGDSVKLAGRLKQIFGQDSEEWSAIKQGLWMRLTSKPEGVEDFGPQALSQRIFKFTNGDGADMAKAMFTAKELGEMRRFATVMKSITPPKGTVNYSNTYYALAREGLMGLGLGGGAFWLTNSPEAAATLAGLKVGGKLGAQFYKGRAAGKHFSQGAPNTWPTPATERRAGRQAAVRAGLGAPAIADQFSEK